jgi:broad specificity phosphatase PhoE
MNVPRDLVLVRHGLSEPNLVQRAEKTDTPHPETVKVYARHDYDQRLAPDGLAQPLMARAWFEQQGMLPEEFDEAYVSPLLRTLETAKILGGSACRWLPEPKIVEREWGVFGATPLIERRERFADTERLKELSSFFTRFDGGESIYDAVLRFGLFMNTLSREKADQRVIAVTHGELMWAARFVVERMLPREWQDLDKDKALRIGNCCVLWYTRQNPDNPDDVRRSLSDGWRLMYDPVEPEKSPYGGQWCKLPGKRRLGPDDIDQILATSQPLLARDVAIEHIG